MKKMFLFCIFIFLSNSFFAISFGDEGIINDDRVNFRKEPNISSGLISTLNKNDKIKIIAIDNKVENFGNIPGKWIMCIKDNLVGYVYSHYVDIIINDNTYNRYPELPLISINYSLGKKGELITTSTKQSIVFSDKMYSIDDIKINIHDYKISYEPTIQNYIMELTEYSDNPDVDSILTYIFVLNDKEFHYLSVVKNIYYLVPKEISKRRSTFAFYKQNDKYIFEIQELSILENKIEINKSTKYLYNNGIITEE